VFGLKVRMELPNGRHHCVTGFVTFCKSLLKYIKDPIVMQALACGGHGSYLSINTFLSHRHIHSRSIFDFPHRLHPLGCKQIKQIK